MVEKLFAYDGWGIQDMMCFLFYNVTTLVDICDVPAGSGFDWAVLDLEKGNLTLGIAEDGIEDRVFELSFSFAKV